VYFLSVARRESGRQSACVAFLTLRSKQSLPLQPLYSAPAICRRIDPLPLVTGTSGTPAPIVPVALRVDTEPCTDAPATVTEPERLSASTANVEPRSIIRFTPDPVDTSRGHAINQRSSSSPHSEGLRPPGDGTDDSADPRATGRRPRTSDRDYDRGPGVANDDTPRLFALRVKSRPRVAARKGPSPAARTRTQRTNS
jgi:hypothetical protein